MEPIDTRTLQQLDAAHHLHPFNDNAALAKRGTRILTRGEGCYVWDAEGNQLLDAFAGQNSTSGGSSDSDANEPMAMPTGTPSSMAVITVTPVGKCPSTWRNLAVSKVGVCSGSSLTSGGA